MTALNTGVRLRIGLGVAGLAAMVVAGCGPTPMFRDRSELIAPASPCAEHRFEIYFDESQAALTPAAREIIRASASALEACDIRRVQVMGLADSIGGTDASNLTLSQQRAQVVAHAFAEAGWPAPAFELDAAGAAGSVTESGASEPMRRRTEVVVDAVSR